MSVQEVLDSLFILMINDYLEEFLGLIFWNDNCLIWVAMINILLSWIELEINCNKNNLLVWYNRCGHTGIKISIIPCSYQARIL